MARQRKTPKPKTPSYSRIDRDVDQSGVYPLLDDLVKRLRPDLVECRLALAWKNGWKKNKDGQLVLGKCKKVSELDKEYAHHDFIIILNKEAWAHLNDEQRRALLFHELCHAAIATDPNGNPKKDARNRQMYRVKKHDIEEFGEVIVHFGCYLDDIENFVRTAMNSPKPPAPTLFDEPAVAEPVKERETHVEKLGRHPKRPVPKRAAAKAAGKTKERTR